MIEDQAKYLPVIDSFHDGLTDVGLAFAVVLTGGLGSGLVGGGYVLYRGLTAAAITQAVGAAVASALTIRPWAIVPQAAGTRYWYRCAAVGAGGVEAVDGDVAPITSVLMDADGLAPSPMPAAPRGLRVAAVAGGKFRLDWTHVFTRAFAATDEFRVYADGGTGVMNWTTAVATVRARRDGRGGAGPYGCITAAFAHAAEVQFGVRARTAGDVEEANVTLVSAVADAEGPAAGGVTAATYGAEV